MNKALLTALTVASLAATSVAVAGQQDAHQGGLYVGGSAGWGNTVVNEKENNVKTTKQLDSNYALRADMGYLFSMSSNLLVGAELGYIYFPEVKVKKSEQKTNLMTFDMLGVVKYYVMSDLNLFGKAGMAYVHREASDIENKKKVVTKKTDGFLPEVAVGAGYNITPALEATVTYAHAFGWDKNNPSFNTVLAGLDYHFSM